MGVNLAYAVYSPFRGRGVASEAVTMAVELAPRLCPVREFVIGADPANAASVGVARRAGFVRSHSRDDEHGALEWFTRLP